MAIFEATEQNLKKAAELIQAGELVAFATETVYGLGAKALDVNACEKIFKAKRRPHYDPLIVHIADKSQLSEICQDIPDIALKAAEKFWPGALTMVLQKKNCIPDLITSNLPTVAVRVPSHPVAQKLLRYAQTPIAAPSANPFGYLSPTTAMHVEEQLAQEVSMILDGGECQCGVESTIVDFTQNPPQILRFGGIPLEQIELVCGLIELGKAVLDKPLAPGQLASHYAPKTALTLIDKDEDIENSEKMTSGLLSFGEVADSAQWKSLENVSLKGDLQEAAHNLFSALHRLDESGVSKIYAHNFPEKGMGRAIMDRLRKASARRIH